MDRNANDILYTKMILFGNTDVLMSDERIDKSTLPEGLYCYDVRHKDDDWGAPITIEDKVSINWFGTIISKIPIALNSNKDNPNDPFRSVDENSFNTVEDGVTLNEWLGETEKLRVLIVEPMKTPRVEEMKHDLKTMQDIVGGYIQIVYPFEDMVGIVCNDEGKLMDLPPNRFLRDERTGQPYDILCGTFFVVGLKGDDFCSLTDRQVKTYTDMYSRERLMRLPKQKTEKSPER